MLHVDFFIRDFTLHDSFTILFKEKTFKYLTYKKLDVCLCAQNKISKTMKNLNLYNQKALYTFSIPISLLFLIVRIDLGERDFHNSRMKPLEAKGDNNNLVFCIIANFNI